MVKYKMLMVKCGGYTALVNLHQVFACLKIFIIKSWGKYMKDILKMYLLSAHIHLFITQGFILFYFFSFIFISWRLITLQYCSGFLTWISHGFTCIPHPDPPSHLPLYPLPLGLPSAPGLSTCLMHSTWAGDLFHPT